MPASIIGQNIEKKIKYLIIIFVGLLLMSTLIYSSLRNISFSQGFTITLETLAYNPPDFINTQERILQIVMMIFGTFIIWFSFWSFMDFIIEGHLYKNVKEWIKMKKISTLKNHFIIYGGGRVGEHVADLLYEYEKDFVVIEKDGRRVKELAHKGYLTIHDGSGSDAILLKAGIKKAKVLMSVLSRVEDNILVVLTAKELNSRIKIYSRSDKVNLINKLKKAGADFVIVPEFAGADIIVRDALKMKLRKHHIGE